MVPLGHTARPWPCPCDPAEAAPGPHGLPIPYARVLVQTRVLSRSPTLRLTPGQKSRQAPIPGAPILSGVISSGLQYPGDQAPYLGALVAATLLKFFLTFAQILNRPHGYHSRRFSCRFGCSPARRLAWPRPAVGMAARQVAIIQHPRLHKNRTTGCRPGPSRTLVAQPIPLRHRRIRRDTAGLVVQTCG